MEFQEAKDKFITTWGNLGSLWGINKVMAQIQALLFVSPHPLSMEDIMEELQISRGNTSMNIRQLMDWGIAEKVRIAGERKEFYTTIKDVEELARIIAKERSRRELQPVIKTLKEVSSINTNGNEEALSFTKQTKALYDMADTADKFVNRIAEQKQNWLSKTILKMMK